MSCVRREREATARFARFLYSPGAVRAASMYFALSHTDAGREMMAKFNAFAMLRLQGLVSKRDYLDAVAEVAAKADLPTDDALILAQGSYEARRCYHVASGLIMKPLGDWFPDGSLK